MSDTAAVKNGGGSAFPLQWDEPLPGGGSYKCSRNGMTLRQYYKAAAPQGLSERMDDERFADILNGIQGGMNEARVAGTLADAMLAEDAAFEAKAGAK